LLMDTKDDYGGSEASPV